MTYQERLQHVSVLGAVGKMGSGILLLTAVEMADLSLKPENKGKSFVLNAIDVSDDALSGVIRYLKAQVLKVAEKKVVALRQVYAGRADLIENEEIIQQYIFDVISLVRTTTRIEAAYDSTMVFEAIREDPEMKTAIFARILANNSNDPWFFTNTSSIPIGKLDEGAGLGGRIIGFHFYNPPAVQKLVEIIKSAHTLPDVETFALQYAKNLRKVVVPSNDKAGFIGNGHFMRDILHAGSEVERLTAGYGFTGAIYAINRISQDYLVRPMGIFQLIDYVGVDVCSFIMSVMNPYHPGENIHSPLLDRYLSLGIRGGQYSDGSQKDGILKYEKGRPIAIYDPDQQAYIPLAEIQPAVEEKMGTLPVPPAWKAVVGSKTKEEILRTYFSQLSTASGEGVALARAYAKKSCEIGKFLVSSGVAFNDNDVNTVLLTGFFHAYGPINDYLG
ncbi:MAG TPA: 3-hydroxyacyl-CoA dehydrogenase family protein [Bacteroidales bacterium]|nr:3-hydroxyacyl-CoA dehydrogenase family protein [Bacteroidales bacterium]